MGILGLAQWLRLRAHKAVNAELIPGLGTKIHMAQDMV